MVAPTFKDARDASQFLKDIEKAGSVSEYARQVNINRTTIIARRTAAQKLLGDHGPAKETDTFALPKFPAEDVPFEELLRNHLIPATQRKLNYEKSKEWFEVQIKTPGPFMYFIMGDQHIDDPYCNLELLLEHIELVRDREDIFVLPMGDLHNNWVGRLEKLYAHQTCTRDQAYEGIKWLFRECGLQIPVAILGNHDVWNEGKRLIKEILGKSHVIADWHAKFKLKLPNGREVLIDAAHDHKGTSIYNALHGQKRAALWGKKAHAFIGAHRHEPGFTKDWWPGERTTSWYIRPGAYKWHDQYAIDNGFHNHQDAPAIALIIDPDAPGPNPIVFVSEDIKLGMEVLKTLQARKKTKKGT